MKVLVTGANGFLGHYLVSQLLKGDHEVIATGRGASRISFDGQSHYAYVPMDFTDPFVVHDVFDEHQPEVVVHAGAMTRVDECELDQWRAWQSNVEATLTLLANAEEFKSTFIFLSTDFVFDGEKGMYTEDDEMNPVNFYGKTKQEAEEAVKEYPFAWAIARTVLVYGKPTNGSDNILTIVKNKLEHGEEYKLVTDQVRTPTYVEDLAKGIVSMMEKKAKGIFHLSGKDILTPYDMGHELAQQFRLPLTNLTKVTAETFTQPAKRPPKTGFIIDKARAELGYEPISFKEGLIKTFGI